MKNIPDDPGKDGDATLCPIARSTGLVGDRWSMMIVRELFMGVNRFQDLQVQTGATGQLLAARLKRLESHGLVERRAYSTRPLRHEYLLTPKGRDLMPVILALRAFGETWCKSPDEGLAVQMLHRACGSELDLHGTCPTCERVVAWPEMMARPTSAYIAERMARAARFVEQRRSPISQSEPEP